MSAINPYAKYLDGRALEVILASTPSSLSGLIRSIGPERAKEPPAPGKWSPAQIACHLTDCELVFGFRLRQTLAEDDHIIQPFDQDQWAVPYSRIPAAQALATFAALRNWNLILINAALQEHGSRQVTHPERGRMTFKTIVETMAGHDLNHLGQIQRIAN